MVYLRFWLRLPARTQLLFAISGILFVGGSMGVEALSALYIYLYDEGGLLGIAITHLQEFLEMVNVIGFVYALMAYITSDPHLRNLQVSVGDKP